MIDRRWQVICHECGWTALVFRQDDADLVRVA